MAIAISIVSLGVSIYALIVARRKSKSSLKYVYTENGLVFFDESGKEIVIHGESIK